MKGTDLPIGLLTGVTAEATHISNPAESQWSAPGTRFEQRSFVLRVGPANLHAATGRFFAHTEESYVRRLDQGLAGALYRGFELHLSGCEGDVDERRRRRGAWARTQTFAPAFLQEKA